MEKRKWLWKRKSSERSPGETESSGSISSRSERYFDDQEVFKASPNHNTQSPVVTSKSVADTEDIDDRVRSLKEKLSVALVNVSAKEDLVKQHAKVAEEAVAGWEKAENEVAVVKQKLEAAVQQNSALEDRVSHLDGALKECVRQLRQAREEQERRIHEAVEKKTRDLETAKSELENQVFELQRTVESVGCEPAIHANPDLLSKLESTGKENSALKLELMSQYEELEIRTIERDLSTQAAETASRQYLESIKKVAKLEAECRRLKAVACKPSLVNDHKSISATSTYVESLTDSHSDSGDRFNVVDIDTRKMNGSETNKCETSCSDSWASILIAELDQFKNEKNINRNLPATSVEIDLMDDFLEMERLAALPENESKKRCLESEAANKHSNDADSFLRAELEAMIHRTAELEEKLEKAEARSAELEEKVETMEAEKAELETDLANSQDRIKASELQLRETEMKLEELQKELLIAHESKRSMESQLIGMEAETRTMSTKVDSLQAEAQKQRDLSSEFAVKCKELEEELSRTKREEELRKTASLICEPKIKQEDLAVAAGKLAECQKTIASLGKQLKSLATLEDFLIDTAGLPEFSARGSLDTKPNDELWKCHSNETFSPSDSATMTSEISSPSGSKNDGNLLASSSSSTSSALSSNNVSSEKNRNGFAKFFSRSKNGIHLEI
ncbi:DUF869 domain-containing protein [Cephalotus follicularis]|uniref:DUF869 domain-containing protein n=1 Tax=Cephalotus follicularis TaxID=3775 RepID=A0A1Q3BW05_CEPFO|nr:DUF869 domain-containing protein [Cephalotus follicularis]